MHELFYMGLAGNPPNPICHQISVVMNALILGLLAITGIQVLCSLMFLARPHRLLNHEDLSVPVVVMLSCYNEGDKELRKTIDSILMTTYPSEDKVLVVIADGVITGKGESHSTPEILASILGFEYNGNDRTYDYMCLGAKFNRQNCIGVYAGTYEKFIGNEIKSLNYVVLVKRGTPEEQGTPRAGNRGKRDSQVVMLRMLNRFLHRRAPTSLDLAIAGEIAKFGHDILDMRYLLAVDADTRVDKDGIGHMVYTMERNKKIIACCGETQVDNKTQSWVTMVQVYEYFSSHHLKKAFESVFGSVTCLPGCFSMYRIFTEDEHALLACDPVLQEYSRNDITSLHERSLYELGEDRMLTTLLLKNFPGLRLDFVPEAICWTIVPHTFSMILSQRRRWINSTIHNLTELLRVRTLCGTCFFSMHMIVFLDMITTLILPATFAYLGYLVYLFIADRDSIDNFVLICIGINFGLQTLSFLLRSRWDFLVRSCLEESTF
jgi:chitin synthase